MTAKLTPVEELSYAQIRSELVSLNLPARGTKDVLAERLAEARAAAAPKPALPPASSGAPPSPERPKRAAALRHKVVSPPKQWDLASASELPLPAGEEDTPAPKKAGPRSRQKKQQQAAPLLQQLPWRSVVAALAAALLLALLFALWSTPQAKSTREHFSAYGSQAATRGKQFLALAKFYAWPPYHKGGTEHSSSLLSRLREVPAALKGAWNGKLAPSLHQLGVWFEQAFPRPARRKFLEQQKKGALTPASPSACRPPLLAALLRLLPSEPAWAGLSADLAAAATTDPAASQKGVGVLLVGPTSSACRSAITSIAESLPESCAHCLLHIAAEELARGSGDARGALQLRLVAFLSACPDGFVAFDGLQGAHPDLLPVLINALSEQGHFVHEGRSVPAWGAVYLGSLRVPAAVLAGRMHEDELKRAAKAHLVKRLAEGGAAGSDAASGEEDEATRHAQVLRRRFEFVAPLQLFPGADVVQDEMT